MAGLKGVAFAMSLIMFYITFVSSSAHGRKLLVNVQHNSFSSDNRSLYLTALPKGEVHASTPSEKGHAATNIDRNLIAARRHLAADVGRILSSVPSPGVGH